MPGSAYRGPRDRSLDPQGAIAIDYAGGDQAITVGTIGVYISSAGALKVDMVNGDTVTWTGLLAGVGYRMAITKIYQTGSSAAGLVLY